MSKISFQTPRWDTSSFGHPADILPLERSALSDHLSQCGALRGWLHTLRIGVDRLHGLLVGHVVTSVLAVTLLVVGAWLMR